MNEIPFLIGAPVNNYRLMEVFQCGFFGGIRYSKETSTIVLITDPIKGPYEDRWEGGILYFTGAGQTGDQSLDSAQNRRLAKSEENSIERYLFEHLRISAYTYRGPVGFAGVPFQEQQTDNNKDLRTVWVFPLRLLTPNADVITEEELREVRKSGQAGVSSLSDEELLERAAAAKGKPSERRVLTTQYIRNVAVIRAAKIRANRKCQLCGKDAPFESGNGEPYLETQHIVWLSKGGSDTLDNTVALCPNCHRKTHALDIEEDVARLTALASGNG